MSNPNSPEEILKYLSSLKEADSLFFIRVPYLYNNPDNLVRYAVTDLLASSNDPEARPYLKELARDNDLAVRSRAQRALYGDEGFNLEELISEVQVMPQPEFKRLMATRRTGKNKLEQKLENNPADFIIVPDTGVMISKQGIVWRKDWPDTHLALAENGLYMPKIDVFMKHYKQVLLAIQDRAILIDGDLKEISREELSRIFDLLMPTYCWLDANFLINADEDYELISNHRIVGKELVGKASLLKECLMEDAAIDLSSLNKQGLPSRKNSEGTIGYIHPENHCVATFRSSKPVQPAKVTLNCAANPYKKYVGLGSFGCMDIPK